VIGCDCGFDCCGHGASGVRRCDCGCDGAFLRGDDLLLENASVNASESDSGCCESSWKRLKRLQLHLQQ
jgi:hypothetical protein